MTAVITQQKLNKALSGTSIKDASIKFANDQPNMTLRLVQRYGYIPRMAVMTYLTLADMLGENGKFPTVTMETFDGVLSQLDADKVGVLAKFQEEQVEFSTLLQGSYGYLPSTAPMVLLAVNSQVQLTGDDFAKMMDQWMQLEAPAEIAEAPEEEA